MQKKPEKPNIVKWPVTPKGANNIMMSTTREYIESQGFKSGLIIGYDKDGVMKIHAPDLSCAEILWLLEATKSWILEK